MKRKYKLKKSAIIVLVLLILIIVSLIFLLISVFKTKSYSLEYNIDNYEISENYNNEGNYYYYEISNNNLKYNFIYKSSYNKEKKLIKEIKEYKDEDYLCLIVRSNYIESYPLCSYNDSYIDYHLISETLQEKISDYYTEPKMIEEKYQNYNIFNQDEQLLLWSYKGFNYFNKDKTEFIKIFNKDIYEIPLATKINNYILIPDYEQEYYFNKAYILNLENLKVEEWNLKYEISFDSYVLGTNDKSIYIIDKKNKKEYELVPHKKKMRIIAKSNNQATIYEEGQISKVSLTKLINKEQTFTYKENYKYQLINNQLYLSYLDSSNKIKVSNQKIDTIISTYEDNVYYLIDDTLYKYNLKYGEVKLIQYSDWEFNYKNLIFINN